MHNCLWEGIGYIILLQKGPIDANRTFLGKPPAQEKVHHALLLALLERKHVRAAQPLEIQKKGKTTMRDENRSCSKCNTTDRITQHHIYPVCHYGNKRCGLKIYLCEHHHREIESRISVVESTLGNVSFGTRFKLDRELYDRITRHYLKTSKIIYVAA